MPTKKQTPPGTVWQHIISLSIKEFNQIRRDPQTAMFALLLPAIILILFGFGVTLDVKDISLAVYDRDSSNTSRRFVEAFTRSGFFTLTERPNSYKEIEPLLVGDKINLALVIPNGFETDIASQTPVNVQALINGTDSNAANIAIGYTEAISVSFGAFEQASINLVDIPGAGGSVPIALEPRIWFNPELRNTNFVIPGLMGCVLAMIPVVLASIAIAREEERGTLESLRVSPIGSVGLIVGKMLPYLVLSFGDLVGALLVCRYLFEVPIAGSLPLLILLSTIFLFGALALGILVSTIADTQQVALTTSMMLTILPAFILSGFMFPIKNMPVFVQWITYAFPARYYLTILRGVILRGANLYDVWPQVGAIILFTLVAIGAASVRYKKAV